MAIDLNILIFTPIFTMIGFGTRVVWERYVKSQEEIRNNKLNSITFKLNDLSIDNLSFFLILTYLEYSSTTSCSFTVKFI